jgi:hypothetical protein
MLVKKKTKRAAEKRPALVVIEKASKGVKSTEDNELVKIELDYAVELDGKFYRGVQEVNQALAERLRELNKNIAEQRKR